MAYTVEQKAKAIAIVRQHDGQVTAEALDYIRGIRGLKNVNKVTVLRWLKDAPPIENATETNTENVSNVTAKKRAVTQADISQAEQALDEIFEKVARRYLSHALEGDVVADTKGKDAIIAAATATDKMRLLRNLPTEIVGILPGLIEKLQRAGQDPVQVFMRMEAALDGSINQEVH